MSAPEGGAAPVAEENVQEIVKKADLGSLLDQAVDATKPANEDAKKRTESYLDAFVKSLVKPGQVISRDAETNIKHQIAQIDKKLSGQLNEIMHHADFQRLEGTWRGLKYLVHQSKTGKTLQIRVMNVTKRELFKDLERATEFDQSQFFKKVYEEEYGLLGGTPYGLLVGDYEFDHYAEDMSLLSKISNTAAAAHAPFVAAASPRMFNMERFTQLPDPRDLAKAFMDVEHTKWTSFRETPDARYVALTLPHVLSRLPYGEKFTRCDAFNFEEFVDGKDHDKYLWMNAAWAYAARVTDAFFNDGWFARTRGVMNGGKVEDLPVHTFPTDDGETVMKCPTEIAITDRRELELSNEGFLPLLHCKNTDYAAFLGAQSCNRPKTDKEYMGPDRFKAAANEALSAMFNQILCVSRFAHYLKTMARDRVGDFMERSDCERLLNTWISDYVLLSPETAGPDLKAQHPLAAARITVEDVKGKPGWYKAVAHIRPHFQLEGLDTSFRLVAELPQPKG
jgi:type VI secretion system protein ImpC